MPLAYLSLGSNIGNRAAHLRDAVARMQQIGTVVSVSDFYETEPVDVADQAWFVNCAVALETSATPAHLMTALLGIEKEMGRQRIASGLIQNKLVQKKLPRTIDIDILLFDDAIVSEPGLEIPHPAMHRRRFVLEPLAEIAPQARHPVLKKTIRELLIVLPPGQIVRKISDQPAASQAGEVDL